MHEYLGLEGGPPTFRQDFTCPALLKDLDETVPVRGCHPLRPDFPDGSGFLTQATGLVRVRSPLLAESRLMSFPPGTEMFQFPGLAPNTYVFSARWSAFTDAGFPIRTSSDQNLCSNSPKLFAATNVLHRLLVPRHSPYTLSSLTSSFQRRLLPSQNLRSVKSALRTTH